MVEGNGGEGTKREGGKGGNGVDVGRGNGGDEDGGDAGDGNGDGGGDDGGGNECNRSRNDGRERSFWDSSAEPRFRKLSKHDSIRCVSSVVFDTIVAKIPSIGECQKECTVSGSIPKYLLKSRDNRSKVMSPW